MLPTFYFVRLNYSEVMYPVEKLEVLVKASSPLNALSQALTYSGRSNFVVGFSVEIAQERHMSYHEI